MNRSRRRLLKVMLAAAAHVSLARPAVAAQAEVVEVSIAAVGDLMLGRDIGRRIVARPKESPFAAVAARLAAADLTLGNLECAIATGGKPAPKAYTFRAPPLAATHLATAGFDLVSLANNHSLDYGVPALEQTLQLLEAAQVGAVGAGLNEAAAHAPALFTLRELDIALLAYVDVPTERGGFRTVTWKARGETPGVAWADPARIATDVAAARKQAGLVVVLLHSGWENEPMPNKTQRVAARTAIDAGACLVIGAHPHVLQGVEYYRNGVIAYSLGNFVFDGLYSTSKSAILNVALNAKGVARIEWAPVVLRGGFPYLAEGAAAEAILREIERLSKLL